MIILKTFHSKSNQSLYEGLFGSARRIRFLQRAEWSASERCYAAPSAMAAPRRPCSSFIPNSVRGKVGGDNDRLLRDESIESCLNEELCSVDLPCVTFCFVLLLVRPLYC